MKIGLKYTFHPNAQKADRFADFLLSSFGGGGAFVSYFNEHVGAVMIGIGMLFKSLAIFTADSESPAPK